MKIAGNQTIEQWEELVVKLNINNNLLWTEAFSFFEERIITRYFNPIELIIKYGSKSGEGFAIVSLQCSLIETIECFINGWIYQNHKWVYQENNTGLKNKDIFISFFANRLPFKNLSIDGSSFFVDVRCGLLHETQTKNAWKILVSKTHNLIISNKIIYRDNLHLALNETINIYKESIINGINLDNIPYEKLRQNFIDKFNHICKISK